MGKKTKEISGITLIALVVTIVVLLILAGITINLIFNDNGIISKAREAKEETEKAVSDEKLKLDYIGTLLDSYINSEEENESEILRNIVDILDIKGLYKIEFKINENSIQMKLDCIRGEEENLHREEVEIEVAVQGNIQNIGVNSSKKIDSIADEAKLFVIILESSDSGKLPPEVVMISEAQYQYKEEVYNLITNLNKEEMSGLIYIEKYTPIDVATWKDVQIYSESAIGIGEDGKVYYWDMGEKTSSMSVEFTPVIELHKIEQAEEICDDILVAQSGNLIYEIIGENYYDTIDFRRLNLTNIGQIKKSQNNIILCEDGKIWSKDGFCLNDEYEEIKNIKFKDIYYNLMLDIDGNVWQIDASDQELICLNNLTDSIIKDIKIKRIEDNLLLAENGELYILNYSNNISKFSTDIFINDIKGNSNEFICVDINGELWRYNKYSSSHDIEKIETDGRKIIKIYNNGYDGNPIVIDENNNILQLEYNNMRIQMVYNNINKVKFKSVSTSYGGTMLLDEENNLYEFGKFIRLR